MKVFHHTASAEKILAEERGLSVVKRFPGGSAVSTKDSLTCSRDKRLGLFLQGLDGEAGNVLYLQGNLRCGRMSNSSQAALFFRNTMLKQGLSAFF